MNNSVPQAVQSDLSKKSMIEILPTKRMLYSEPGRERCLSGMFVTPIIRLDEVHFILESTDRNRPIVFSGYEEAICLQVLVGDSQLCDGYDICKIFFYATYERKWEKISFTYFDPELVEIRWPDCDPGAALKGKVISPLMTNELTSGMSDDYSSSAFGYWWWMHTSINHAQENCEDLLETDADIIEEAIEFGDIITPVIKYVGGQFIFALETESLLERIGEAQKKECFLSVSGIHHGENGYGRVCYIERVERVEYKRRIINPGRVCVGESFWKGYRKMISAAGFEIKQISPEVFETNLTTEIDLKPEGISHVLSRGQYQFEIRDADSSFDDDLPF